MWIFGTKNIFKYFRTEQNALDLHDDRGDGVQVVEEAGAAVGVSPHLDMVHGAAQQADEGQQQTDLHNQDLGYWKNTKQRMYYQCLDAYKTKKKTTTKDNSPFNIFYFHVLPMQSKNKVKLFSLFNNELTNSTL